MDFFDGVGVLFSMVKANQFSMRTVASPSDDKAVHIESNLREQRDNRCSQVVTEWSLAQINMEV